MALFSDSFTGTNGSPLGVTEVGSLPWLVLTGSWYRSGGLASTSSATVTNPLAVVELLWADIDMSVSISFQGGDALYFRVTDALNWYRTRLQSTGVGGSTTESFNLGPWVQTGTQQLYPGDDAYGGSGSKYNGTLVDGLYYTGLITWGGNVETFYTRTVTQVNGFNPGNLTFHLVTEKSVAGVITQLNSTVVTSFSTLRVTAVGSAITVYGDSVAEATFVDTTFLRATRHGIGRGGPTALDVSALDNFSLATVGQVPASPVLTYPINGQSIDGSISQTFTINFQDNLPGSTMSAWALYYRLLGEPSFVIITVDSSIGSYTFAPGTLTSGNYEWQAETYDNYGALGVRSGSQDFSAVLAASPTSGFISAPIYSTSIDYELILVNWTDPVTPLPHYRLLRSTVGNSVNETDGTVLLSDLIEASPGSYTDSAVLAGTRYYYTLFYGDSSGNWWAAGVTSCLAIGNLGYAGLMSSLIPDYFTHVTDEELVSQTSLLNPALQAFLGIFGWGFDQVKSYYDTLLHLNDTATNTTDNLENLAAELGVPFESTSAIKNMRNYVGSWTTLMQEKGTLGGLRDQIRLATGWDTDLSISQNLMLDEDQASFVNPKYTTWTPDFTYQAGDRVLWDGYIFQALEATYGPSEYPALSYGVSPTIHSAHSATSVSYISSTNPFGSYPLISGTGPYNVILEYFTVPSDAAVDDYLILVQTGVSGYGGSYNFYAQPYGTPAIFQLINDVAVYQDTQIWDVISGGPEDLNGAGRWSLAYSHRVTATDLGGTVASEWYGAANEQSVLLVVKNANSIDTSGLTFLPATSVGSMTSPTITTTVSNDLIAEIWVAATNGGNPVWSSLPGNLVMASNQTAGFSTGTQYLMAVAVSSSIRATAGLVTADTATLIGLASDGENYLSCMRLAISLQPFWETVATFQSNALDNPATGNVGTWEALSGGLDLGSGALAIAVGVPSALDSSTDANALILNYSGPAEDISVRSVSLLTGQLLMDPYQPILDGIPLSPVTTQFSLTTDYGIGDIVYYNGYVYQALIPTQDVYPPIPANIPNASWQGIGIDQKIQYTASIYAHTADFIGTNVGLSVTPFIEWYDNTGTLISVITGAGESGTMVDNFGGTTGSLSGRQLNSSNAWSVIAGGLSTTSNTDGVVQVNSDTTRTVGLTLAPAGDGDVYVTFTSNVATGSLSQVLYLRSDSSATNYIKATRTALISVLAGVPTTLCTYTTPAVNGDRIRVNMAANTFTVYVNGVQVGSGFNTSHASTFWTGIGIE